MILLLCYYSECMASPATRASSDSAGKLLIFFNNRETASYTESGTTFSSTLNPKPLKLEAPGSPEYHLQG